MDSDSRTRAAIEEHWRASESGDSEVVHAIYADDAVLDAPTYSVSIMGFADEHVLHETQYFADPFPAPASRAPLAQRIPGNTENT